LLNLAIIVEVVEKHTTTVGIETNWVLQRNLRDFFALRPSQPGFSTSSLDCQDDTSSLLLFKIILAQNETAIAVSWHHTLGDAAVLQHFMRCLSERYSGSNVDHYSTPSFTKRTYPSPSRALFERYS
ncbi:hypothetical protein OH77DRAFT_1378696, partial [Trametes cingulata]